MAHFQAPASSRRAAILAFIALNAFGCGSSATTSVTSPAPVSKCGVSVAAPGAPVPARGGSGEVAVTTARECAWSAASESGWLTIKAGASGQGDGTVQFEAGSNPDPALRRGSIVLNNQRAEIMQAAGECTFALAEEAAAFDPAGGSGRVEVRPSSALCTWTAAADADWISIRSGATGTGTATVSFDVAPTAGAPRTGSILVAGRRFTVTQSQGCSYTLSPPAQQAGPEGGSLNVAVTTSAGCAWAAASDADWITVTSGGTGNTGPGTVTFTVQSTAGPSRSGTLTIAGRPFTVTQAAQACAYTLTPDSASVPAAGGTVAIAVESRAGCAWTAASQAPWITIASGSQGTGNGTVQLQVAATTGTNRSGTATIAGRTFTVNQGQGCAFTINPSSGSVDAAGGPGSFDVQTESGCAWSANESADWVSIVSGATGSGNGSVRFTATANTGAARTSVITAAGRSFTLTQAAGCSYALSSTSTNLPAEGGTGSVGVTSAAGCAWTASSNADWITVTAGARGTGNGNVSFSAPAHTGARRSGTLTIGGRTFTVTQAESCSFAVSPDQWSPPPGGGTVSVRVDTSGSCRWTAASNASWITLPSNAGGEGGGAVQLTAAPNSGSARTGTATVAGRTVTVQQASGCAYTINPASQTLPAQGGGGSVTVTTAGSCNWTAETNLPWARVTGGASGSGSGAVQFTADANTGPARSGTFTVAGQTFTLNQEGACTFAVAPETIARGNGSSTERVDVTAGAGCGWTAASSVPWATISSGASGTGNGVVEIALAANSGPARSATVTVATRGVTVSQGSGCTYTLSAASYAAPAAGGQSSVNVAAPTDCTWTATVQASPWITVISGASGSGNGAVQFSVEPNPGAPRTGSILIAGQTFTVTQ